MSNAARRKTLDDIRQEIEAEFGPPPETRDEPAAPARRETPRASSQESAASARHPMPPETMPPEIPRPPVPPEMSTPAPREYVRQRERLVDRLVPRPTSHDRDDDDDVEIDIESGAHQALRRRGYVIAGLIGCIVGQCFIFGLLTTRYWMAPPAAPQFTAQTAAGPTARPNSDRAPASTAAELSTPTQIPDSTAPVARADTGAVSETAESTAAPAAPSSPSPVEPAPIPAPVAVAPPVPPAPEAAISMPPRDLPSRLPPQAPHVSRAPAGRAGMSRSTDWVAAQAALRAALREWLVRSGLRDVSVASDAVVILDVDGRTARTSVPVRWGGGVVIREQRWERHAKGWTIVEDR
jgi:hypothetical protein